MQNFPATSNVKLTKELDTQMRKTVKEKQNKQCHSIDKAFESIQKKVGLVFAPMSSLWDFLDL